MNYKIARNFALGILPGLMLITAPVSASTGSALTHISSQSINLSCFDWQQDGQFAYDCKASIFDLF